MASDEQSSEQLRQEHSQRSAMRIRRALNQETLPDPLLKLVLDYHAWDVRFLQCGETFEMRDRRGCWWPASLVSLSPTPSCSLIGKVRFHGWEPHWDEPLELREHSGSAAPLGAYTELLVRVGSKVHVVCYGMCPSRSFHEVMSGREMRGRVGQGVANDATRASHYILLPEGVLSGGMRHCRVRCPSSPGTPTFRLLSPPSALMKI